MLSIKVIQPFQLGHFGFQFAVVGCGNTLLNLLKKDLRIEKNVVLLQRETQIGYCMD